MSDNASNPGLGARARRAVLQRVKRMVGATPTQAQAEQIVTQLYRVILQREPDAAGLQAFSAALADQSQSVEDVVAVMAESEEFNAGLIRRPAVTRRIADEVIGTLLRRPTGEQAVSAYSGALTHGMSLRAFVEEITGSGEYLSLVSSAPVEEARPIGPLLPNETASQLVGQIYTAILQRLSEDGYNLALSQDDPDLARAVDPARAAALTQTLAMLGAPRA